MIATPPRPRRGATFIEILISMAILAGAMVPISSMMVGTAGQTAQTKAEGQAANFAASVMNRFLDNEAFDDVTDGLTGEEELDGTSVRWTLQVFDFDNNDLFFAHRRIKYHRPNTDPTCQNGEAKIAAIDNGDHPLINAPGGGGTRQSVDELDQKNRGQVVLKELRLTVQWKTARDGDYEDPGDPNQRRRTVVLLTRRARL